MSFNVPSINRQDGSHCSLGGCPQSQGLKDAAVPIQRNTSLPTPASPETAAPKGKGIDRLPLSEKIWEQSQVYQAKINSFYSQEPTLSVKTSFRRQPGPNQLEHGRLIIDFSLVSEDLYPQASQVFTRQREKNQTFLGRILAQARAGVLSPCPPPG